MANFKETDQTYKDMDARFETLLNIAPLTQSNLTKIYSTFNKTASPQGPSRHIVVMKYYKDGDLYSYIKKHHTISQDQKMSLIKTLLEAVNHLHKHSYKHGSITTDNIMVENGMAYLGGLSTVKLHKEGLLDSDRQEELTALGGCICYIEFGSEMEKMEPQEMLARIQSAEHLTEDYKNFMISWVKKQIVNKSGEVNHVPVSFSPLVQIQENPQIALFQKTDEVKPDIFEGQFLKPLKPASKSFIPSGGYK
jgi:serine/threonine protein kinase